MKRRLACFVMLLISFAAAAAWLQAADNPRSLVGNWSGKATGPQGTPPTGDILLVISRGAKSLEGKISVKGSGGGEYSGEVSDIRLEKGIFSATALFKLGELPLEIQVTGPVKGKSIEGTFTALSRGKKIGEGTFAVTRQPAARKK